MGAVACDTAAMKKPGELTKVHRFTWDAELLTANGPGSPTLAWADIAVVVILQSRTEVLRELRDIRIDLARFNDELSNIALAWMVSRAVASGLPAPAHYIDGWYNENTFRRTRDSHAEFLSNLWFIGSRIKGPAKPRQVLPHQQIHRSVVDRIDQNFSSEYVTNAHSPADSHQPYTPAARLPDGSPLSRERLAGLIDETPDYLQS